MKKIILLLTRNPDLLARVMDQLRSAGFEVIGVTKDQDALNHLRETKLDLLLIGGGVEISSRKSVRYYTENNRLSIKILENHGSGAKLIEAVQKVFA